MTTIDVHAHAIVPAALSEMAASHPDFGPILVEEGGRRWLRYPGRANLGPLPDEIFDPELRLAAMERQRVDVQVIAIPPPNFHYHVPARVGNDFATIQNDALLRLSDTAPDRFHLFAALPLQDIDSALREIDRVAAFPRVRGVQIGTNVDGMELDDPTLAPIWESLQATDLPVWLHPDQRSIAGGERLNDFYLQNLIGLPLESTIAMARLVFGGVASRYPSLRFGFVHGGGFSPYQIGRWDHGWTVRDEPKANIEAAPPRRYFNAMFFDSLTHDPLSLEMLGRRAGWGHVLLGSDFPFDMADSDPVTMVESIGLDDEQRDMVLGANAARFLRPIADVAS